jgi:hypothetical protein
MPASGFYWAKHKNSENYDIVVYYNEDEGTLKFVKSSNNKVIKFNPATSKTYTLGESIPDDVDKVTESLLEEKSEFYIETGAGLGKHVFRVVRILSDGSIHVFGSYSSETAAILVKNRLNSGKLLGW